MPTHGLAARVGKICYPVTSFEQVSNAYLNLLAHFQNAPPCEILNLRGQVVYWVSRNGKIWHGRPGQVKPDTRPIYEPL